MKDKILLFIIGVLVGALISTGGFLIYTNVADSNSCNPENMRMNDGNRPGDMGGFKGERPEMPNGENGEPPEPPTNQNEKSN